MHAPLPLKQSILQTAAFFDGLSFAMSDAELWQRLFVYGQKKPSYVEFVSMLNECISEGSLVRAGAFLTIPGRTTLATDRIRQGMMAEQKYRIVRKAVRLLRFVPFIRMVGVCNTLAFDSARREGDIDLFIVAKSHRIYIVYALSVALLSLFGLRRRGLKIQNRMCLSFYVSESGVDMSRFALSGGDPYLAQWTTSVVPSFSVAHTFSSFKKINEEWLKNYFDRPPFMNPVSRFLILDSMMSRSFRLLAEVGLTLFAPALEKLLRAIEQQRFQHSSKKRMRTESTGVVVDAETLKFHEEDRRAFYRHHMRAYAKS